MRFYRLNAWNHVPCIKIITTHMESSGSVVVPLPGEIIHLPRPSTKLGPGTAINKEDGVPFYCKAGTVKRRGDEAVWINCIKKRVKLF